jgi:plastocyanin
MASHSVNVSRRRAPSRWLPVCVTVFVACGSLGRVSAGAVVTDVHGVARAAGRAAANAVVWLDAPNAPRDEPGRKIVLDQRDLRFSPLVLAVRVGTTVTFPNNDRVFHNVFSFHHGKVFDLGLYPVGASKAVQFDKPGVSRIFCNIHPNMAAYVFAVDSPYFAVSNAAGAFTLPGVPTGRYTYHAWRSNAAEVTGAWAGETSLVVEWPK